MAMATLFVLPAYTKREYVLSYNVLLDSKTIREYRFNITEKALSGILTWLFAPIVPFLEDVAIGEMLGARGSPGPMSSVVREATRRFVKAAHEDGMF